MIMAVVSVPEVALLDLTETSVIPPLTDDLAEIHRARNLLVWRFGDYESLSGTQRQVFHLNPPPEYRYVTFGPGHCL